MFARSRQHRYERSAGSGRAACGRETPARDAPRHDTHGLATVSALVITLVLTPCAFAQPQAIELMPDWDRSFQRGIEWCQPVGREPPNALLLCTKDAHLELLELETGHSRLDEALPVQPGTRFADARGEIAYCHGVSRLYAIRVASSCQPKGPRPGLLWSVATAPQNDTGSDPEFMTHTIAAQATPGGVVIVRSDGRIAELLGEDGSLRWQGHWAQTAECRLFVRDTTVALIGKSGKVLAVAFLDLTSPRPRLTRVEQPPPIWSDLLREGLVAVWQQRFALFSPDGNTVFVELPPGSSATAAALAVFERGGLSAPAPRSSTLLLASSTAGPIHAYDFTAAEWRGPRRKAPAITESAGPPPSMRVCGDRLLLAGRGALVVYDAVTCEALTAVRHGRWVVAGTTRAGAVYGLFAEPHSPREAGPLRLVRQAIPSEPPPRRAGPGALETRHFLLGDATLVLETFWLDDALVVVEDGRVRAYTLP
jgi:hypothetical protein